MFDINLLVRKNIKKLTPYSSARDEFSGKKGVFLDANENPFGMYNRYPDPYQKKLKKVISSLKNVDEKHLFLGNGSDEAIDLLFRIFCTPNKDKALTFTPTYGMYQVAAEINDVELLTLPLNNSFQIDVEKVLPIIKNENLKIIFICSPNNPTGNSLNKNTIELLLQKFKGIVVIDEAYIDFSPEESWSSKIEEYPNMVVLQTLSKAWGLASLRLGIAIANKSVIKYLNRVKPPYNISHINQKTALKILKQKKIFTQNIQLLQEEKQKMIAQLSELSNIREIYPSNANFLLIKVNDANTLYKYLISKNIIIRNRNSVIKNCLRISIGTPIENELLIQELKRFETNIKK